MRIERVVARHQRRTDEPRIGTERRLDDLHVLVRRLEPVFVNHLACNRQQELEGGRQATADGDHPGVEGVDESNEREAEARSHAFEDVDARRVSRVRELHHRLASGRLASSDSCCERAVGLCRSEVARIALECAAADVRLDAPDAGAVGGDACTPVEGNRDMSQFRACTDGAAQDAPAGNDAAAESGPQRDHEEVFGDACARTQALLGQGGDVRVVVEMDLQTRALAQDVAQRQVGDRQVGCLHRHARALVERRRNAESGSEHRTVGLRGEAVDDADEGVDEAILVQFADLDPLACKLGAIEQEQPGDELRSAEIGTDDRGCFRDGFHVGSYTSSLVKTSSEKPYRVYRQRRRARGAGDGSIQWADVEQSGTGNGRRGGVPRRALRLLRRVAFVGLVLAVAWLLVAFLSFRSAVKERNDLLPKPVRAALAPVDGPALADDQVTLLVGADTSSHRRRVGESDSKGGALSDTLILMRVDVPSRTVSMLSIPRDLYVEVPGYGREKINTAYKNGGLPLAIRTVRKVTGVDVNHVAQVDFDGLRSVVESLGGIEIDNPYYVGASQSFDGRKPVFPKGKLQLDGRDALAYARMRYVTDATRAANQEEATELGRARRQQRVIDAIVGEIASFDSLKKPRGVPRAVVAPLITDISASQMLTFGFGKWWSKPSNNLRCRLGGDADYNDAGQAILLPVPENRATIRMWMGQQAPVKPANAEAPGCVREGG